MRTKLHWPSVNAMVLGLGLCLAVSAVTPTTSHAIPSAGDYTFTSGLTGTFTSDGTQLTKWSITDPGNFLWETPSTPSIDLNDTISFRIGTLDANNNLSILWPLNMFTWVEGGVIQAARSFAFAPNTQTVPEGTMIWLLALGLLALLGYDRRQRRQVGVQVG